MFGAGFGCPAILVPLRLRELPGRLVAQRVAGRGNEILACPESRPENVGTGGAVELGSAVLRAGVRVENTPVCPELVTDTAHDIGPLGRDPVGPFELDPDIGLVQPSASGETGLPA